MKAKNARGVIAESYYELQGLHLLKVARDKHFLPKSSAESTLRAVFQAAEIALLNLDNLTKRAAADIKLDMLPLAMVKMSWSFGFHQVLSHLSKIPPQLAISCEASSSKGILHICESPAFIGYVDSQKLLDSSVLQQIEVGDIKIGSIIAERSIDDVSLNLLHLIRVCNHEATIWEHNLAAVCVPLAVPSYEEFVVASSIREAVYDIVLEGDTCFTQFRGLHQIPEILSEEVNDNLEHVIFAIRSSHLQKAIEHLNWVNIMCEGILTSLSPMVNNLVTSDYHQIRENLGLTSGGHSVCLRYHLFKDLYEQLWKDLSHHVIDCQSKECQDSDVEEAIRQIDRTRFDNIHSWTLHLLFNECLKLRAFINQWRETHLHLPRNELGGNSVKSLTGSPDAIAKVKQMRNNARKKDPMQPLVKARGLEDKFGNTPLADYLELDTSLDNYILKVTGEITRHRFKDVQERSSLFAKQCPFSPPPPRIV